MSTQRNNSLLKVAAILGLTLVLCEVQAQTEFGAKAGLNMSRMASGASHSEYLFGFHAGIYFRGTSRITLQLEMMYSGQGGGFRDPVSGQVVERRLHYLNPTFMLRYQPSKALGIVAGPLVGVLITAKEGSTNISDLYDPMDLGLNIGADYEFEPRFFASFRFYQSMRKIDNQVFQVSIGYRIQRLD